MKVAIIKGKNNSKRQYIKCHSNSGRVYFHLVNDLRLMAVIVVYSEYSFYLHYEAACEVNDLPAPGVDLDELNSKEAKLLQ